MQSRKHTVRKVPPPVKPPVEEQLWLVNIALGLLAAFIAGSLAAYLPFDEPRWYLNAKTWLIAVPLTLAVTMWGLRLVSARAVRRTVQLAAILSLLVHVVLMIASFDWRLLAENPKKPRPSTAAKKRAVVTLPEYHPHHFQSPDQRQQQEYEKPVETKAPEADSQSTLPRDEQVAQPARDEQPIPVVNPVQQAQADISLRRSQSLAEPRQARELSQLSKQATEQKSDRPQRIEVPQVDRPVTPNELDATSATPARPRADPVAAGLDANRSSSGPTIASRADAVTPMLQSQVTLSRAESERAEPQSSAAPTAPRAVAQPLLSPRSPIAMTEPPATSRQTAPDAMQPRSLASQKQTTASPETTGKAADFTSSSVNVKESVERKSIAGEVRPNVAQTPAPVPNQPTDAVSVARQGAAAPQVERTVAAPAANRPSNERPNDAAARESLAATDTATRKQERFSPETGRSVAEPTPVPAPSVDVRNLAGMSRQETPMATPAALRESPGQAGRTNVPATANVATSVAKVPTNSDPREAAESLPGASATAVARQAESESTASIAASQTPSASPLTQAAAAPRQRSVADLTMRLPNPTSNEAGPARTVRDAEAPQSPRVVEFAGGTSPSQGATELVPQPGKLAMAKSLEGVAGSGRSENLDHQGPAAPSPALVASGAARRSEASQVTQSGAALSPSAPAMVRSARAAADRPSAPFRAQSVDVPTETGAREPDSLTASSSASTLNAQANERRGDVTAAAGNVEVDLGSTRVVAEDGKMRASGGGQPALSSDLSAANTQRARSTEAAAAVVANRVAEIAAAPAGREATPDLAAEQPASTPSSRTLAGGDNATTAAANATSKNGPAAEVASAPNVADVRLSRADQASGGAGNPVRGGADAPRDANDLSSGLQLARTAAGGGPRVAAPSAIALPSGQPADASNKGEPASADSSVAPTANRSAIVEGKTPASDLAMNAASGSNASPATLSRAPLADALPNPAQPGGGSPAKGNASVAPNLVANVKAPNVQVDGADMSAGKPQGAMLEARGLTDQRFAGGVSGRTEAENVGAAQGDSPNQASASAPAGPAVGVRNAGVAGAAGVKAMNDSSGGPFVKSESMAAPRSGASGSVEIPAGSNSVEAARDPNPGAEAGTLARAMPATTVADIAALEGPGGLGDQIAAQAGIDRRATHSDEPEIRFNESRFVRRNGGGVPRVSTTAVAAAGGYQRRVRERKTNDGPADENDAAIERGLSYLARQQRPDGSWSLAVGNESTILSSDVAATGLALLAFHGANYNHRQDKYQDQVRAGLDFLVRNQREDGDLFLPADDQSNQSVWLYSHSIAALALSEAYGMTQDPALREPAQRALQFIVGAQHPQRGGWRYAPGVGADTSVSGWMTMALESGKRAGLQVPDTVYVGMQRWLDAAQISATERHLFRYNPWAADNPQQRHGRSATKTMTAVGLLMRLYCGWKPDHPDFIRGTDYLAQQLPRLGTTQDLQRDTYYWYYATQVMLHRGGAVWESWRDRLFSLLRETQVKEGPQAGSWDPLLPVPDKWGAHAGRLYVTAMNLLSLEVKNRSFSLYEK